MTSPGTDTGESKFELAISYLLIIGVVASLILVLIGILFCCHQFGFQAVSEKKEMFLQEKNFFYFLLDLLRGEHGPRRPLWFLSLGIAILILTPYARVMLSVLHFIRRRDLKFTLITLFVLILLTVSLLLH